MSTLSAQQMIEKTKAALVAHLRLYRLSSGGPNEKYHYNHACAYESLLRDFGVSEEEINEITAEKN